MSTTRNPLTSRVYNLMWEGWLGISTRGTVPTDRPDATHYATMNYGAIRRVLRELDLQPGDVFVDVGCGRGRVLCLAARAGVRRVIGVDFSFELCQQAVANSDRLRGRHLAPVEVVTCDARTYDYSDATVLFFFDPFGPETCEKVLARIAADTRGRSVRIAYANPTHEAVFDDQTWLKKTGRWEPGRGHAVVFYRSFPAR